MKIAVTGGSGGIGRAIVVEALKQGHSVVSIDKTPPKGETAPNLVYVRADITDYDAMVRAFYGCDALVHMGAIPAPIGRLDHVVHNNNVVGSYNALRAAVENGIKRVCQASSVNAIGLSFSREAHFDYFPIDEEHPTYAEEPYSLSKWICEQQADSFVRRYEDMRIASMRYHWVVPNRAMAASRYGFADEKIAKHLWAYTLIPAAVSASLLSLTAEFSGHEVFYVVAPDTTIDMPSRELAQRFFPKVPIRGSLDGYGGFASFFSCAKAERILGWKHGVEPRTADKP
jgi:nucleoside-diphosphate-sugar epimerase